MPPPHKGSKIINHRDVQYRWIMQNKSGSNELVITAGAAVDGQTLIAGLPKIVNLKMVTAAIDFGRKNGWTPEAKAEPFRCKWARTEFIL